MIHIRIPYVEVLLIAFSWVSKGNYSDVLHKNGSKDSHNRSVFTATARRSLSLEPGSSSSSTAYVMQAFDWHAYLELNADLRTPLFPKGVAVGTAEVIGSEQEASAHWMEVEHDAAADAAMVAVSGSSAASSDRTQMIPRLAQPPPTARSKLRYNKYAQDIDEEGGDGDGDGDGDSDRDGESSKLEMGWGDDPTRTTGSKASSSPTTPFRLVGPQSGRPFTAIAPSSQGRWQHAADKLAAFVSTRCSGRVSTCNLVIYNVEDIGASDHAIDVTVNNVKVFVAAVLRHAAEVAAAATAQSPSQPQEAFYLFNVAGLTDNPMSALIPAELPNVAVVPWTFSSSAMNSHLRTLGLLGGDVFSSFGAVFCLGSGVRGPLVLHDGGEWISEFRRLLDENNVGIVGPIISCEGGGGAHVQTHMFAVRSAVVPVLLKEFDRYYTTTSFVTIDEYFEQRLSGSVVEAGYAMASVLHGKRFEDKAIVSQRDTSGDAACSRKSDAWDAVSWCHVHPKEVVFVRWSGEPLGARGFMCGKAIAMGGRTAAAVQSMSQAVRAEQVAGAGVAAGALRLRLPEALTGGVLNDMYEEFKREAYTEDSNPAVPSSVEGRGSGGSRRTRASRSGLLSSIGEGIFNTLGLSGVSGTGNIQDTGLNACFLVRVAAQHLPRDTPIRGSAGFEYVQSDIHSLIKSLLRQSDPRWKAFFVGSSPHSSSEFAQQLQAALASYTDGRLTQLGTAATSTASTAVASAAPHAVAPGRFSTTDQALGQLVQRRECGWLSITDAGNAYGSEVVARVLQASPDPQTGQQPDMILSPLDSRKYAALDGSLRGEVGWDRRCVGIEAMLKLNLLTYTVQPLPTLARTDLAAAFLNRARFLQTIQASSGIIGNLTAEQVIQVVSGHSLNSIPLCCECKFESDSYLLQYLVRNRGWSYRRLGIDGLRSIVYHGPSPTLCIASGNVWFDHPRENKAGCLTHETVMRVALSGRAGLPPALAPLPPHPEQQQLEQQQAVSVDWEHFFIAKGVPVPRVCLRLSEVGFYSAGADRDGNPAKAA